MRVELLKRHSSERVCERIGHAPSDLSPLAGRGRNLRIRARIPGEGATPRPQFRSLVQPPKAHTPTLLPASGARENSAALIQPTSDFFTASKAGIHCAQDLMDSGSLLGYGRNDDFLGRKAMFRTRHFTRPPATTASR